MGQGGEGEMEVLAHEVAIVPAAHFGQFATCCFWKRTQARKGGRKTHHDSFLSLRLHLRTSASFRRTCRRRRGLFPLVFLVRLRFYTRGMQLAVEVLGFGAGRGCRGSGADLDADQGIF